MQVYADIPSNTILQVDTNQTPVPMNGKYLIPIVQGVEFTIDQFSYILNGSSQIDNESIVSKSYAHLLAKYPYYETIYFNPLITAQHVRELDLTATFPSEIIYPPALYPSTRLPTRVQTGRYILPGTTNGNMPTHTALPIPNSYTNYDQNPVCPHPGLLITDNIDISAYTIGPDGVTPVGTDEFCAYWQLVSFTETDDINSNYGATNGLNEPAIRYYQECSQEPTGFQVFISPDDGLHWCPINFLEPITFAERTTAFRLAFVNNTESKIYLAAFAVMF